MGLEAYSKLTRNAINTTAISRSTVDGVASDSISPATLIVDSYLDGYRLPDFRDRIKLGIDATTPMNAFEVVVHRNIPYYSKVQRTSQILSELWNGNYTGLLATSPDTSLVSTQQSRAYEQFYSRMSSFNGLTVLGELRETVRMLRNPALALRKGVDRYISDANRLRKALNPSRSTPRKARRDYADAVAGSWLEYNFGWRPFINDIQDAFDALTEKVNSGFYEVFKVSSADSSVAPRTQVHSTGDGVHHWRVLSSARTDVGVRVTASVRSNLQLEGFPSRLGFLPENFVPTLWELAPWSFLVDYFSNIGQVLDAWAISQRLEYAYCSQTTRVVTRYLFERENDLSSVKLLATTPGLLDYSVKNVARAKLTSVPIPQLGLRNKLSTSKGLNLAALASLRLSDEQLFRSLRLKN